MVPLNFSLQGYQFQSGLKVIRDSFLASSKALGDSISSIEDKIIAYEKSGVFVGELDEDGNRLWSEDQRLGLELISAKEGIMHMRKACVIVLYHHWEKAIGKLQGGGKGNHEELIEVALKNNVSVDVNGMERLRLLVNTLKHNSETQGKSLKIKWPDVFLGGSGVGSWNDWYGAVFLKDSHLEEAFSILYASGPQTRF
ncbi:hypothetical protein [Hoeflea alexandrii]|uniref:hypothetical protein n=1 Tax=Hoeflea alexandrii TaxID=288436 RepID=UPI0022AF89C5|nr:hypothetical protein [Hoeflea alexandrii]MCZ4288134.1 hypothetical protein [Hoeflea alexandrii]